LRLTSRQLAELGAVDDIIQEPIGGAHRDHHQTAGRLKMYLIKSLHKLVDEPIDRLLEKRYEKFRRLGVFMEENGEANAGS
jgi:acetyl-CoA carboxylase carboxyl transferase subunit alpha